MLARRGAVAQRAVAKHPLTPTALPKNSPNLGRNHPAHDSSKRSVRANAGPTLHSQGPPLGGEHASSAPIAECMQPEATDQPRRLTRASSFKSSTSEGSLSVLQTLGVAMPNPEDIILDRIFDKLAPGNIFLPRRLLATRTDILIARPEDAVIIECIPLASIASLSGPDFELVREPDGYATYRRTEAPVARDESLQVHRAHQQVDLDNIGDGRAWATEPHCYEAYMFSITTEPAGVKRQITLHFKPHEPHADSHQIAGWVRELAILIRRDEKRKHHARRFEAIQRASKEIFDSPLVSWTFAGLILMSYMSDVAQAQYQPAVGTDLYNALAVMEVAFTLAFLLELLWNLFSNW